MKLIFTRLLHRKYYLKKLLNDKMTVENVAAIFKTSNENVEAAYRDYIASRNPFKKHNIKNAISIVGVFLTIFSLVLVFFTLREMQTARDVA